MIGPLAGEAVAPHRGATPAAPRREIENASWRSRNLARLPNRTLRCTPRPVSFRSIEADETESLTSNANRVAVRYLYLVGLNWSGVRDRYRKREDESVRGCEKMHQVARDANWLILRSDHDIAPNAAPDTGAP